MTDARTAWTLSHEFLQDSGSLQINFRNDNRQLTYGDFLGAVVEDPDFRNILIKEMQTTPFDAFRWETPPVSNGTVDQPFTCILHDSPDLQVTPDPTEFQAYFDSDLEVVSFQNLGADAWLIAPCPISSTTNYSHIAVFHRSAPDSQKHALWIAIGKLVRSMLSPEPLWLSTAGGGVDWLHVRIDQRPKYYRHAPWRSS